MGKEGRRYVKIKKVEETKVRRSKYKGKGIMKTIWQREIMIREKFRTHNS
jgi:hypothetical protein